MDQEKERKKRNGLLIKCGIILFCCIYLGLQHGAAVVRYVAEGHDPNGALFGSLMDFGQNFYNPAKMFPTNPAYILMWLTIGLIVCAYSYVYYIREKNTMYGKEHGSASFNINYDRLLREYIMSPRLLSDHFHHNYPTRMASGGRKQCSQKKFSHEEVEYARMQAQIYSKRVSLSLDTKLTQLNLNAIVFGGSGAGKSRFFVFPNLLQANSSYIVTDPSGELMQGVGKFLESQGYEVRCLNLQHMDISCRYNPFAYVKEDSDIPIMVNCLINNIEGPKKGGSGDNKFWEETASTLLIALCGYLFETQPMERRNFNNVLRLLNMADVSDDREEEKDDLDLLFDDLELANPQSYAVSQYKVIKQAGQGKTAQNIVISTSAIFARFFQLDKIANLTYKDEMDLESIGRKKTALFIVTPQGDTTYNFLASMLYTQLFNVLYKQGENNARERGTTSVTLDVPVRCLIDEAANIGVIPGFAEKMATMRKYGISCCPIYQNQSQVKALMDKDWESIVGNADTLLFLGGIDSSTVKLVSERLGKGTINTHNHSINHGRGAGSMSISASGRELMTTTEIEQMPNDRCIVFIRSMKPFYDYKYPLEEHPNYKYSGMADDANSYEIPFHLEYDRQLMQQIAVKRKDDDGYQEPERADWATDADIASVRRRLGREEPKEIPRPDRPKAGMPPRAWRPDPPHNSVNERNERARNNVFGKPLINTGDVDMGRGIRRSRPTPAEKIAYEDDTPWDDTMRENLAKTPTGKKVLTLYDQRVKSDHVKHPEYFEDESKNRKYPLPYDDSDDGEDIPVAAKKRPQETSETEEGFESDEDIAAEFENIDENNDELGEEF